MALYGAPVVAAGSDVVTKVSPGGGSTGSEKLAVAGTPSESVAVTLKETLAGVPGGGVPLKTPAVERCSHVGRLPEVQVYGGVPKAAVKL